MSNTIFELLADCIIDKIKEIIYNCTNKIVKGDLIT